MKQLELGFRTVKSSSDMTSLNKVEHHMPKNKRQCKWHRCKDVFDADADLVKHLENKHFIHNGSGGRNNVCRWTGCRINGRTFSKTTHLYRHVLQHHGGPRPYICQQTGCGKAFSKESALALHAAYHSRVTSPVPIKPVQKPSDSSKQRPTLYYHRITPPVIKQFDSVDAPTLLAISQWMQKGHCRSRNTSTSIKRKPHPQLKKRNDCVIAKRISKLGREILCSSPRNSLYPYWVPVSCIPAHPTKAHSKKFTPPTTMTSLLSAIAASATTET